MALTITKMLNSTQGRRMTYLYRETIVNFEPKSKCLEEEEEYFISNSDRFRHVT